MFHCGVHLPNCCQKLSWARVKRSPGHAPGALSAWNHHLFKVIFYKGISYQARHSVLCIAMNLPEPPGQPVTKAWPLAQLNSGRALALGKKSVTMRRKGPTRRPPACLAVPTPSFCRGNIQDSARCWETLCFPLRHMVAFRRHRFFREPIMQDKSKHVYFCDTTFHNPRKC